ncbi:MAG: hypothetical protein FH753_00865 [Firmicutes bacterium]|nr:hypothetical protein [Bacillota bacterium]
MNIRRKIILIYVTPKTKRKIKIACGASVFIAIMLVGNTVLADDLTIKEAREIFWKYLNETRDPFGTKGKKLLKELTEQYAHGDRAKELEFGRAMGDLNFLKTTKIVELCDNILDWSWKGIKLSGKGVYYTGKGVWWTFNKIVDGEYYIYSKLIN